MPRGAPRGNKNAAKNKSKRFSLSKTPGKIHHGKEVGNKFSKRPLGFQLRAKLAGTKAVTYRKPTNLKGLVPHKTISKSGSLIRTRFKP
jgi:hypothetical protein